MGTLHQREHHLVAERLSGGGFRDEVQRRDGSGIRLMRNSKRCCHGKLQPSFRRGAGPDSRFEGRWAEHQGDRLGPGSLTGDDQP